MEQRKQAEKGQDESALATGIPVPSTEIKEAKPPEGLNPEEERDIQRSIETAVKELEGARGSQLEEMTDKLANIGYKAQERVSTNTQLEQEKLSLLVDENDEQSSEIKSEIERLDETLVKFAREGAEENILIKLASKLPLIGKRLAKWARAEGRKRKTIADFSQSVEVRLRTGRDGLQHNNAEMLVVLKNYEKLQFDIMKNAYAAELLAIRIQGLAEQTKDEARRNALNNILFHVVARARDLRQFELMYETYFAGIHLGRDANRLLTAVLTRLITMGVPAMTLGLIMRAMLVRQREGIAAANQTRETISNLNLTNAQMIRQHIKDIGRFYKEGALDSKKAEEAANILIESMNEMDRIKMEAIPAAREQIEKAKKLTQDVRTRAAGTRAADVASLEIGELPTRPTGGAERPKI